MPLMLGQTAIVDAITTSFQFFRQNLNVLVPEIYAYASQEDQAEISTWWQNTNNQVIVESGYPFQPVRSQLVSVTVRSEQEVDQYIDSGRNGAVFALSPGGSPEYSALFRSTYDCHCFSINQRYLLWLQVLVKWALLFQRHNLQISVQPNGSVTGYFVEQKLSASDIMPVPNSLGDSLFPFERIVSLTATHLETWPGQPYVLMQSGTATITDTLEG